MQACLKTTLLLYVPSHGFQRKLYAFLELYYGLFRWVWVFVEKCFKPEVSTLNDAKGCKLLNKKVA